MDIAPGSEVAIEITAAPKGAAACKTLMRICSKDPAVAKAKRWRKAHRPSHQTWRRGGRFWHHRMRSRPDVRLEPGVKYSVRATLDVMRDLESVKRFVKVSAQ